MVFNPLQQHIYWLVVGTIQLKLCKAKTMIKYNKYFSVLLIQVM